MIPRDEDVNPQSRRNQSPFVRSQHSNGRERLANALCLIGWTVIVVALFWPFLRGMALVGYRDSVQFYWPMFRWADAIWAAGEVPLWNPHDGLGRSHLAEGTSSLFYPGKFLFWMRWTSFEARYGWYLAAHVWLAGWGAGTLAGRFGAAWPGRGLATLSYGLAGPVLFAATNAVYLVSAAWLPWGLAALRYWREPSGKTRAVLGTAAVAALMILGGDPQMAGNLLLLAAGSWCWWGWNESRQRWQATGRAAVAWLATTGLVAALAAVQILPSWQLSAASSRVDFSAPRSVAEWLMATWRTGQPQSLAGLWREPEPGSHQADIDEFSQPPWTLGEWIWPGSSGRPFPEWTHWASSLPGAGRMWQPSLYQGLAPLLLAMVALCRRELRWLGVVAGVALFGSWGWYGPVWLWNEIGLATGWWTPLEGVNRAVGGVYWWLVCLVPGYAWFRYPAKLLILATLAIAVLGGCGWGALTETDATAASTARRRIQWLAGGVLGLSATLLIVAWSFPWARLEEVAAGDEWFGPFSSATFRWQLVLAGGHTLTVSTILWALLRNADASQSKWHPWTLLGLSAAELLFANAWLCAGVSLPPLPSQARTAAVYWGDPQPPVAWRETSSSERLAEVVRWEVAAAYPRVHWLWGERMLNAPSTIEQRDWQVFLDWLAQETPARADGGELLTKQILFESDRVWSLVNPRTTAEVSGVDGIERFRLGLIESETGQVVTNEGEPSLQGVGRVTQRTTQTVSVELELAQAGVVFLSEGFAPGWRVAGKELNRDRPLDLSCIRVGNWLRGVWLEPGRYELQFFYSPSGVYWCLAISIFCWLILLFYWIKNSFFKHLLLENAE
ncbi:MAG: hypothetical protein ACK6CE_09265 [Planctomycetota bacterium]